MRRITIRNLRSQDAAKPRVFDALIDGDEVYLEVKSKNKGNEIIALHDVLEQIAATCSGDTRQTRQPGAIDTG